MNTPDPKHVQPKERRRFIACAALAVAAAATAHAQDAAEPPAPPATPGDETERAVRQVRAEELKRRLESTAWILRPLIDKYGPEVLEVVRASSFEGTRRYFAGQQIEKRDLDAVRTLLWEPILRDDAYRIELLERTATTLKYRVTKCPHAEILRAIGAADIGLCISCAWDYAFCAGLNPKIEFTRTKTLMQGDDCCNHAYELPAE